MKKLCGIGFVVVLYFTIFTGCSMNTPDKIAAAFLEEVKAFDFEEMNRYFAPDQAADLNLEEEFSKDGEKEFYEYFKKNAAKLDYQIKDTEIEEDSARVTVHFRFIDGAPYIKGVLLEYINKTMGRIFSGETISEEEMEQILLEIMKEKEKETEENYTETDAVFTLKKIEGDWYLSDFDEEFNKVLTCNFSSVNDELTNELTGAIQEVTGQEE